MTDAYIIYSISDSQWATLVHVVPKKGRMTVVTNKKNKLIPTRTVTSRQVYNEYHKLNDATCKDHFPLTFIDQMIERLSYHLFYFFLDVFSCYSQIPCDPRDQEKTTFTCLSRTFGYR